MKAPRVTVGGDVHGVALLFEPLLEEPGCFRIILDHENPHLSLLRRHRFLGGA